MWGVPGLCLCLFLALQPDPALAVDTVTLQDNQATRPLGEHVDVLVDPDRQLSFEEVKRRDDAFQPGNREVLNFGYTQAGYWVRLRLQNPGASDADRFLEFGSLFADHLALYQPTSTGSYRRTDSGRLVPPPERPYTAREFVFPIAVSAQTTQTFYLYVDSADTLTIPLYLHTAAGLADVQLTSRMWLAFYHGLLVPMLISSLFLLIALRDRVYLYYIGALLTHQGLFFLLFDGLGYELLGLEDPWWSRQALAVFLCLAMWMIMQFARVLLDSRQDQPVVDRLLVWIQRAALAAGALGLFLDYSVAIRIANPVASVTAVALLILGVNSYRREHPAARYFLVSWTASIVGGLAYSLKSWTLLPSNLFTEHAWQAGAAIEAIFLSMAIANRIHAETRRRIRLQQQAQKAQAEALAVQREANETLERRVQERTEALGQANQRLQALSETDPLTGLSNRRSLERNLADALAKAALTDSPIALLLLDLDHFKAVNDTRGHLVGDDCLKVVADRLKVNSRWPSDTVARFGGEEFCLLLNRSSVSTALDIAERIRRSFDEEAIATREGPVRVTVSIGLCVATPSQSNQLDAFLAAADRALYAAKTAGRNRTVIAESLAPSPETLSVATS